MSRAPMNHALDYAAPRAVLWRRWVGWGMVAAWVYPAALVAVFYATWLVAWMTLGRRPRASLDDPKSIGAGVDFLYGLWFIMVCGFPAAGAGGVAATGWYAMMRGWRSWVIVLMLLLLGASWAGMVALLRWGRWWWGMR